MELTSKVFATRTGSRRKPCKSTDQIALHLRYAKIGIAAVAAAARYQSSAKNPGISPAMVGAQLRRDATS